VKVVPYEGKRAVYGFNNLVDGRTSGKDAAAKKTKADCACSEARVPLDHDRQEEDRQTLAANVSPL
jgi:hypothetical protein